MKQENNTKLTFDELKEIRVNLTAGRPSDYLTDESWQKKFNVMKSMVDISADKNMKVKKGCVYINGIVTKDDNDKSEPQWVRYRNYINDVLREIRAGGHDFCYYIYQISDLLRFENERLRTRYRKDDECFEVWLSE